MAHALPPDESNSSPRDKHRGTRKTTARRKAAAAEASGATPTDGDELGGTVLRYGGLPRRATLAERLSLPVLKDMRALTIVTDGLEHAVVERKGALVIGVKGAGKTIALDAVLEDFHAGEEERVRLDAGLTRRQVVTMVAPKTEQRTAFVQAVHRAFTGEPMETHRRGKRIDDDELLELLIHELLNAEVAAIVVDEAEGLSDTGLTMLRDIISMAESRSPKRYANGKYLPAGVGVLLLGTPELEVRIAASDEAGRRWLQHMKVPTLNAHKAARVYRKFLPCLEREAVRRTSDAWEQFIHDAICPGKLPISSVENHVRHYARRVANSDPSIESVDAIPFLEDVFISTFSELMQRSDNASE